MKNHKQRKKRGMRDHDITSATSLPLNTTQSGLHRLIYTSEAIGPGETENKSLTAAKNISTSSALRNAEGRLSGVLIAVRGNFIQVLEGPSISLEETFERICCDMRHRNITLIDFCPANDRRFPDWDMALMDVDHFPNPESLEDLLMGIIGGMAPDAIVREIEEALCEFSQQNTEERQAG